MFIPETTQSLFGKFYIFYEIVKSKPFKSLVEKFSKMFYSILNKAYAKKNAYVPLLDVEIQTLQMIKKNQPVLPRHHENFLCRDVFNIGNSYANVIILVYKFVTGPSRFGYDCDQILGSLLIEKQLVRTSKMKISILLNDFLVVLILATVLFFFLSLSFTTLS